MARTTEAVVQFRSLGRWVALGEAFFSAGEAQKYRQALMDAASASNGPDARQYIRAHTRVVEMTVTTTTEIEVVIE